VVNEVMPWQWLALGTIDGCLRVPSGFGGLGDRSWARTFALRSVSFDSPAARAESLLV